jgi:malate dehydrogenase (quinone)
MLELMQRAFPKNFKGWEPKLSEMMPGYGIKLNDHPDLAAEIAATTSAALGLAAPAH